MSDPNNAKVVHQKRVWLNQIIVDLLKENPEGINKLYFWNIVAKKAKSLGPCSNYGVKNMNSLLHAFNVEEVKINNVTFVKLKSGSSSNEMLSSKINHLKEVVCGVLQSNGGQVKRSLLWSMVAQKQGHAIVASDYGVRNNYEILTLMSDTLTEIKIGNDVYVKLNKMPTHIRFLDEEVGEILSEEFPTLAESMTPTPKAPTIKEINNTLKEILVHYPDGVDQDKIWDLYKDKTGKSLPRPEDYKLQKRSDFFNLPDFKNIRQFPKNGKTWITIESWNDVNQQRSDMNVPSTVIGAPLIAWGGPAGSLPQVNPQGNFLDYLWANMQQTGSVMKQSPVPLFSKETENNMRQKQRAILPHTSVSQAQKGTDDSLYLSEDPILPVNAKSKNIVVNPINLPRGMKPTKDHLNDIAKECIEIISDAQECVTNEKIQELLLQRLGRTRLHEIGLRDLEQLDCIYEHNRLLCKVNAFTQAFVKVRSICTLRELEQCLCDYVIQGKKFDALKLGPLHRLPVVFDMFKYPLDEDEFPNICTLDVMQKIRDFLTDYKKWTEKLQMEEIMNYLIEAYDVSTPYHLGIRIRSLPLVVGVLKRAQSDAARNRRSIYDSFKKELESELKTAFGNFRHQILSTKTPQQNTLKLHYLKLNVETVVAEIFEKLTCLMNIEEPPNQKEREKKTRRLRCFEAFVKMLKEDRLAQMLFHVAVCVSNTDLQDAAMEILAPSSPQPSTTDVVVTTKPPPAKEEILKNLRKYLGERLNQGSLNLIHLDKIEGKLLEDFQFQTFSEMGYGRFIKFILGDPTTKRMLDESGVTLGSSPGNLGDSLYQPQISDVLSFVQQCLSSGAEQHQLIEDALCHQFAVKDVKKLGFGTTQRLVANSERRVKSHNTNVLYETALCAKERSFSRSQGKVGILGHQTKEAALAILHNCPLLEDMSAWSHWPSVFEPQFGKLKDFVNKYGGEKNIPLEGGNKTIHIDILAMETEPGKYLKLVSQTSIEHFTSASMSGDMLRTCGHLASIVAHHKGLHNAPLALLANHMKTTLFSLQGMDIPDSPYVGKPAKFVLDCLVRLPLQISISLANQIFLEPLGQVLGQTKSKSEILNCCSSISDSNRLEELGYYLGISDWSDSLIKLKSSFLKSQIETIAELESEDEFIEDNEIEEETSDDEEESASLSDEEDKEFVDATEELKSEQVTSVTEKMVCDDEDEEETIVADVKEKELEEDKEKQTEDTTENVVTVDEKAETVDTEPKEEINQHKELINLICSEEFGIGVQLNEDGEKLMRRQQERLGRSLDRLSKDLYSKDSHFVLELVQNADDNSYPEEFNLKDSKQRPSVNFSIDATSVTVLNNECGFKEKDIRALCDVGKSTKGKHKFGYIGQKGIGFKSVFRVTDTPQIHSNDYHICFDVNSGPMGYIQPHWIEDSEEIEEGWVTKIVLPLKESLQKSKSLAASFNDIHPSLLLFLHRLKEISINNKVENSQTRMCRYDLDNNVIEIHYDTTVNQWLVLKKLLDASNISSQVKSGVEVESTEIALAFPLKNCNVMQTQLLPPKQPVFAFLPLRSYGFRFIIQGDFDLPSSREDVDKDSPWNQWLRSEIPTLFLESLEQFKTHPSFKSVIHAVAAYLQFIPGEDEVLDFFRPVAAQILKKLRSKPCIPTQPLNKDSNVLWKIPSQTVIVPDALMREVAPPEMLQKLLNIYYIHSDMANLLNSSLVHSLGIEKLTSDHLLKIGEAIATSWINVTSVEADHLLLISKWLACVYRSLDDFEGNEEILAKVCNIKIIPMSNGKLIALKDASVFLPLKTEGPEKKKKTKDPYLELWKDLNSIHPDLMCTEDAEINSQVHKIVLQLGVKELFANNIICHHILPILTGDEWKTKSEVLLVNYVCYIKEQSEKNPQFVNFDEFVPVIQLKTNHGMKKPCETSIHFTPAYGNSIDLQRDLSGYDWILLDNCYVKDISQRSTILSWHEFFSKLGVTNFLAVEKVSVLIDPQNYMECPWSPFYPTWPVSADGIYHVKDYACPEFTSLVKHNKNPSTYMHQMQKLSELLDRDWDSNYCKYAMTTVYSEDGQHALRDTPTSFAIDLQQLPWLPARRTILTVNSGYVNTDTQFSHQKPNSVYCDSKKLESLLGHAAFYLNCTLSTSSSFSSFLQIKSVITVDVIVDLLTKWSNRPDEANKTPTEFCTSMSHIKAVYMYLSEELNNKTLQDLFHTKPVIFVPDNTMLAKKSDANVVGKMYKREELWWEDSTGLFRQFHTKLAEYQMSTSNKREIVNVYGDMENFFQTAVRILKFPQLYEYGELIQVLTLSLPDDAFKHVLTLFELIGEKLFLVSISKDPTLITVNEQNKKKLISQIRDEAIFPTKQGTWVSLSENPIIADDKELEKLFAREPINFVRFTMETNDKKINRKISRHDQDKEKHILEFLNLFNVAKLSESYTQEAITEHYKPFLELQDYMNKIVPILQRYLCANFSDIYNNWKELKLHDQLLNWKFAKVGKLDVIYSLMQNPDIRVIRKETCLIENNEFKVREDAASSEQDIDRYIARYFSLGNPECFKNLKLFLSELKYIMKNKNQKDIEDKLAGEDVYPLPPDEPVWFVPEPIWPVLEPTPLPPVTKKVAKSTSVTEENKTEKSDKDEALRAWPPRASSFASASAPSQSTTEKVMTMWPAPQGPSYKEQIKGHTKFTLASSESVEDVLTSQQPSSGNREHGTSASEKENENKGNTDDGRRRFESKDITGEPRPGVYSRSNSQLSETTKPASNVDVMSPPQTPRGIASRHPDDPNRRSEQPLSDTDAGMQSQSESPESSEHRPNRRKRSSDGGMEPDAKRHAEPSLGKCVTWFSPNNKNSSVPVWLQTAQDVEYKELTVSSDLKIPDSIIDPESNNYNLSTGRWGENLVFNYLLQQKVRSDSYIFSVVWVNEMQESGKPFDFECQLYKTDGTDQSLYTVYIEVKSTLSDKKEAFEISGHEVQFAFEKQSNFHVYRVYNAGNAEKVRLVKIENLASQIDQKNVRLCLVI